MINTKRILVAGGSGFPGINLCKDLLAEGHEVICLDNLSSGSRANLTQLFEYQTQHGRLIVLEQDVSEPVIDGDMDEISNLACVASPIEYQDDPLQTLRSCTDGTSNLLKLAIRQRARMFNGSPSGVYGNQHVHPQTEDCFGNVNPIGPRRVVSSFFVQALLNRPITIVVFKPLPKDDPARRRPDIGRARRLLKWKPCVALEPGLIRTISYFERLLQAVRSTEAFAGRQDLRAVDF